MLRLCLHTFTVTHSQNNSQETKTRMYTNTPNNTFGLPVFFCFFCASSVCFARKQQCARHSCRVAESFRGSVWILCWTSLIGGLNMNKDEIMSASAWIDSYTDAQSLGLDLGLGSIVVLWVIVFILTNGALPKEPVWMAKWEHSEPLAGTRRCFYTRLCLSSVDASPDPFQPNLGALWVLPQHSDPYKL